MVDNTPGAFLLSKILELCCKVFKHEIETILPCIAFLSWCTVEDVKRFKKEFKQKLDKTFADEKEREYWSQDELYKNYHKAAIKEMCRKQGVPSEGKKHECVQRLSEKMSQVLPSPLDPYDGEIASLSESITEVKKMPAYRLRNLTFSQHSRLRNKR